MGDERRPSVVVSQYWEDRPGAVFAALSQRATSGLTRVRIAVAYVTLAGCRMLFDGFQSRLLGAWEDVEKQVVTSFDYGLTEPEALEFLMAVENLDIRVANVSVIQRQSLVPNRAFHAKAYLFDYGYASDPRTELVVGSANLTQRALTVNTETMTISTHVIGDTDVNDSWSTLTQGSDTLTSDILNAYRAARVSPHVGSPPDDTIDDPDLDLHGYALFSDAVELGAVDPWEFHNFWLEAGSMTSGGSNNQLELPRGANVFFGLDFRDYAHEHASMGEVDLLIRGTNQRRQLRWHASNRMERIHLPTVLQGGYPYAETVILFSSEQTRFAVHVVPKDSAIARSWMRASASSGHVYRIGAASNRICGLF